MEQTGNLGKRWTTRRSLCWRDCVMHDGETDLLGGGEELSGGDFSLTQPLHWKMSDNENQECESQTPSLLVATDGA